MEPWALFQLVSFAYQTASHKGVHHLTWLHFTLILEKLSRTIEIGPLLSWDGHPLARRLLLILVRASGCSSAYVGLLVYSRPVMLIQRNSLYYH
jgi:hypothetical protein